MTPFDRLTRTGQRLFCGALAVMTVVLVAGLAAVFIT